VLYEWGKDQRGRWIARVARVEAHPDTEGRWYSAKDVVPRDPEDERYRVSWLDAEGEAQLNNLRHW
jgi:hypothetical protein